MNTAKVAKSAAKFTYDQLETLGTQLKPQLTPFVDEARDEVLGFFSNTRLGNAPRELAKEQLKRAREEQELARQKDEDNLKSSEQISEIRALYVHSSQESAREQNGLKTEHEELKTEVAKLAKAAGVDTKIHLQNSPKVGKIDIGFITFIIHTLRVKAEQSRSAKDLVAERQQVKATGMLAWVSGKQMKIHEQGTLQLQG